MSSLVKVLAYHCLRSAPCHYLNQCWLTVNGTDPLEQNKYMYVGNLSTILSRGQWLNTLRPGQNGRHFPDAIFVNENVWISIEISLNFVPSGPTDNIPALVQMMAWRRPGDKPLSEPMMVILLTHICVTRPQWVNSLGPGRFSSTCISKYVIFKHFVMSDTCKSFCEWVSLRLSQHWFR